MTSADENRLKKTLEQLVAFLGWGPGCSPASALVFVFVAITSCWAFSTLKLFGDPVFNPGMVSFPALAIAVIFLQSVNGCLARRKLIEVLKSDDGTENFLRVLERERSRSRVILQWVFTILISLVLGLWYSLVKWPT